MTAPTIEVNGVPRAVAERLESLVRTDSSGEAVLDADDVLAEAASLTSPLHSYFEWDDTEAAREYRRTQAQGLIRRVKITIIPADTSKQPVRVRAFVSTRDLKEAGGTPHRYRTTVDVLRSPDKTAALESALRRDIESLRKKYQALEKFEIILKDELGL